MRSLKLSIAGSPVRRFARLRAFHLSAGGPRPQQRNDTTSNVTIAPPAPPSSTGGAEPALRRELGRWDLTAIGINQVIGAAVFAQPALLAAHAGAWSPWMVAAVGVASMLIALSFAEVGSRFEGTGGPYLYTRAAFGRFAAFEVGWMLWFTRAASWAAVINVLATSLSYYWRPFGSGPARAIVITLITVAIAAINVRGIRQSSIVVNVLTAAKLIPLAIFIGAGLFAMDASRLAIDQPLTLGAAASSGLLLIFGFGGYEVVPVVAGETKDPRRAVPFALIVTIAVVTLIMTLTQVVAIGTLPESRELDHAARERRRHLPRRRRRRADDLRRDDVGVGQQHGAGAVGHQESVCAGRARRSAGVLRRACTRATARRSPR